MVHHDKERKKKFCPQNHCAYTCRNGQITCWLQSQLDFSFLCRVASTYTTPSLAAPNAVSASTYPQMYNLSTEHVQALLHPPTGSSNLLSSLNLQRHTSPVANPSHPKFPPALIPVNGSSNSSRYWSKYFKETLRFVVVVVVVIQSLFSMHNM